MTRPRATTSPSDALGATIADLKARLARLENIAHQHRVLGSHLGLQEIVYFDTVGTASFVKADYPWLRAVRIRVQAGGGGGAGRAPSNRCGAGGSGGGYAERFFLAASLPNTVTVTVGGGGAGGAAGDNNGGAGGDSSFGGVGDAWRTRATGGPGTVFVFEPATGGGVGTHGDLLIAGQSGSRGDNATPETPGIGGSSHLGGGTTTGGGSGGRAGGLYGGGGSGASVVTTARAGGAGAQGIVIVELYA